MTRPGQFPFTAVVATIAAVATVLLIVAGSFFWRGRTADQSGSSAGVLEAVPVEFGDAASLFFPATSGRLEVEERRAPGDLDSSERRRWLAEQLLAGPESEHLRPVFPVETQLGSVVATPDGTVFIDLTISDNDGAGMGSTDELLTIYSVVNTILLDDPSAQRAVLLINGRQRETLAGHLDTSRPLYPRPDLIGEPG